MLKNTRKPRFKNNTINLNPKKPKQNIELDLDLLTNCEVFEPVVLCVLFLLS